MNIKNIIDKKIEEYEEVIKKCNKLLPEIKIELKKALESKEKEIITLTSQKIMLIKDTLIMNEAGKMALTDLLREISEN